MMVIPKGFEKRFLRGREEAADGAMVEPESRWRTRMETSMRVPTVNGFLVDRGEELSCEVQARLLVS